MVFEWWQLLCVGGVALLLIFLKIYKGRQV